MSPSRLARCLATFPVALVMLSACSTPRTPEAVGSDVSDIENLLISAAFDVADRDRDGLVTLEELQAADSDAEVAEFRDTDADGSGGLVPREFEIGMNRRGAFDTLIANVDSDGDGVISADEEQRFRTKLSSARDVQSFPQLREALQ